MQHGNFRMSNIAERGIILPVSIIVRVLGKFIPCFDPSVEIFFIDIHKGTEIQIPPVKIELGKGKANIPFFRLYLVGIFKAVT